MNRTARRTLGLAPAMVLAALAAAPASSAGSPSPATLPPTDCPADVPLAAGSIATIAGGGTRQGDGGQALEAWIDVTIGGLAVQVSGTVLSSGFYEPQIRRIGVDGVISTLVDPAPGAPFRGSSSLALDGAGNLYIADPDGARIWRMDAADGTVTPVAGTGSPGSTGNEGPALQAAIRPTHVAVGPDGLFLDDGASVRLVTSDGFIHAFAGTGTSGSSGDGGPAVTAQVGGSVTTDESYGEVMGMVTDLMGDVYLADTGNQRIRRIDPKGIITTVAGTGERGYSGDGGPAIEATFQDPVDVALDEAGNLYISDHHNRVVRRVDTSGVITTVAGFPAGMTSSGDCGPAVEAGLQPWAIEVHDGYLYIGDMTIQRIGLIRVVRL
jgi:hypothetical protein